MLARPPQHSVSLLLALLSVPATLCAQAAGWSGTPAASFADRFREVWKIAPAENQAAVVKHLVLRRDVGEMIFEEGQLYLLQPVGGQVMGALFRGKGTFNFTPPLAMERERLKLFRNGTSVAEPFTEAVLLFADSTLDQLRAQLTFGPGRPPSGLERMPEEAFEYHGDEGHQSLDPDLMRPFLNGERTGLFLAMMRAENRDPWMFLYNPHELESVQFLVRAKGTGFTRYTERLAQFTPQGDTVRTDGRSDRRREAHISRYALDVRLPSAGGGLGFSVAATLTIAADTAIGPWVAFGLFDKLDIDSATWADGAPATVFKGHESPELWVRCDRRLQAGETRQLRLYYHGDLLDRAADLFFIKSSIAWYPLALDGKTKASFDLRFTYPEGYGLASVGDRADSAGAPGHMIQTHWVVPQPIRNASFTVGVFDSYQVPDSGVPPTTVLWSEATHRMLASGASLQGKDMKAQVGSSIANAMRFYTRVYGEPPVKHFAATEIPWLHGEAWPGIVGLSYATFHASGTDGGANNEVFRAHEVAHQWWGIAVDYATYRDRWLSEGFSNFSGLWYLQTLRGSTGKYFDILNTWKGDIMLLRDDPLPIWLGHRVATARRPEDYDIIIYKKGAWVLHMLRTLLLDLKGMNEDRFTKVMQTYYSTYRGKSASTADFQRVAEQVTGQQLGWFFDEWIYRSDIPTYKVAWKAENAADGKVQVTLRVRQEQVPPDFLMYVPVTLDLGSNQFARLRVKVTGAESMIALPLMPAKPKSVKFNDFDGVLAEVKEVGW